MQRARRTALTEVQAMVAAKGRMGALQALEEQLAKALPASAEERAKQLFMARLIPYAAGEGQAERLAAERISRDLLSRAKEEDVRIQLIAGLGGLSSTGWTGSADAEDQEPTLVFLLSLDTPPLDAGSPFEVSLADLARRDRLVSLVLREFLRTDPSFRMRRAAAMGLGGADDGDEGRRALSEAVTRGDDSRVAEAALEVLARKGGPSLPPFLLQVVSRGADDDAALAALGLLAEKTPFTDETHAAFAELLKAAAWADGRDRIAAAAFRFLAKDPSNPRTTAFLHALLADPAADPKVLGVFAAEVVDRELVAFVPAMKDVEARLPEASPGREALAWATRRMGSAEFLGAHRSLQEAVRKREGLREALRSGALDPARGKSLADELQSLNREIDALETKLRDF